jgi:hypothetical protein
MGMVGEQVVLGWLTLELTDSPLLVGLALGARMWPHLLVGIPGGVLADRVDRDWLLRATSVGMAALSALLGLLVVAGEVQLWSLLGLTFVAGCVRSVHMVARQGYAHDLAGAAGLVRGLALIGLTTRAGGLVGSLVTGALVARLGSGAGYLAVAVGYLVSAAMLGPPRAAVAAGPRPPPDSVGDAVRGFLLALAGDRRLPALVGLAAAAEVFGFAHQALLPSLARDVLHVGADGLGALTAARSMGGIAGLAAVSGLGQFTGGGLLLGALFAFGGSLVTLGLAKSFVGVLVLLIAVNAIGAVADLLVQSLIQLTAPSGSRGRAGGAWVVAIGMAPLGQIQMGAMASAVGVTLALGCSGVALMVVAAAVALWLPRLRAS